MRRGRRQLLGTLTLVGAVMAGSGAVAAPGGTNWVSAGGDRSNTRFAATETKISPATVGNLSKTWEFTTGGDVSATPAVDGNRVYFPDWAGNLYAVDRNSGRQVWARTIASYTGIPRDKARATPAISDGVLVIGTQGPFGGGGAVLGIDKDTGSLLWRTQVESHYAAIITQSATIYGGRVFVGVASQEEALAASGSYPCCSFRGSMTALDLRTGALLWKTYTAPEGFPGNAVWGSSPAVDPKRGTVYIGTGNNYSAPDAVLACVSNATTPEGRSACLPPDDLVDSVVALDMVTGAVRWSTRAIDFDAWTVGCIPFFGDGVNCPVPAGPDYDFGQAPALFTVRDATTGSKVDVVGAGQKSGQYWALRADTGQVYWVTQAGPGGTAGGLQWGSAVDGRRVYTANANSNQVAWNGSTDGVWSALDAQTGQTVWQTRPSHHGSTSGPVTTANGVVFGCALDADGWMYALDAASGAVLWSFASGGGCLSGAAISNGQVFWGSGYSNFGFSTPNNKLYAFGL